MWDEKIVVAQPEHGATKMTEKQARKLKVGSPVQYIEDAAIGEVVDIGFAGMTVKWSDGLVTQHSFRDQSQLDTITLCAKQETP